MFVWNPITIVLGGLLVVSAVLNFAQYGGYKASIANEKIAHTITKDRLAKVQLEQEQERVAALNESLRMQQVVLKVQGELDNAKIQINKQSTALKPRVDSVRVRESVASFSSTPATSSDDIHALKSVVAQGIELLEEGRQLLRECAADHDTRAAEIDSLMKAWPRGNMTLNDMKKALLKMDEVTLLEVLDISSEDLVERFGDFIEAKADILEEDLEADVEFYDGQEDSEEA